LSESGFTGFKDFQDENNILFVCSCVLIVRIRISRIWGFSG